MTKTAKYPPIMSRTAFCPKCALAGRPKKETVYMTYCGRRDAFAIMLHVGYNTPPAGMTPHLFSDPQEYISPDGKLYVLASSYCCVNGCGISLTALGGGQIHLIRKAPDEAVFMPRESYLGLIDMKDKELQLSCVDNLKEWDLEEIIRATSK